MILGASGCRLRWRGLRRSQLVSTKDAGTTQPLIFHTVTPGELPITVTERGNLESQNNVEIICEVDDIDGDGVAGTQIISIVPNGTSVKQGDLLVEFDSARHRERLDRQILDTESARATQIQAEAKYENQISQNETLLADALLDVELAKLEQKMFVDEQSGTHKLEVEDDRTAGRGHQQRNPRRPGDLGTEDEREAGNRGVVQAGIRRQAPIGPKPLDLLQAESQYVAKVNKLNTQLATLKKKQNYEKQMEELTLQGQAGDGGPQSRAGQAEQRSPVGSSQGRAGTPPTSS